MKKWAFIFFVLMVFAKANAQQADTFFIAQKGFKSLFKNDSFDSTQPYEKQLNPRAISFVQEYIRKHGKELERMKTWGKPYFNLYDNILRQYNIPVQLKYLSVIESHLQSNLVSWAGAVGPWQIMDYEAKRFGLRVGAFNDERTDYVKSTHVACKLMKELYKQFGDWLLVVAAYNGGAGRVRGAIRKSGSREFWDLQYYLLEETRTHVKKFIATHYIFEGGASLITMTAGEQQQVLNEQIQNRYNQPQMPDSLSVKFEISGRYNSVILCNTLELNIAAFNLQNPDFDKTLSEGKKYSIILPKHKKELFEAKKNFILQQSIRALMQ